MFCMDHHQQLRVEQLPAVSSYSVAQVSKFDNLTLRRNRPEVPIIAGNCQSDHTDGK